MTEVIYLNEKKNKQKNKNNSIDMSVKAENVTANYVDVNSLNTDPQGSWTGKPDKDGERPVQDVDDL